MRADKADPALPPYPTAGSLAALVGLGTAAALWFLFLWLQLVLARAGGTAFCALDAAASCTTAWDSPFASQIHRLSGLPLAGWGLVWGLSAFLLPLLALLRQAEGRPQPVLVSATRLLAVVGVAAVAVMLLASAVMGVFCVGCLAADLMIAGYAGIALFSWAPLGYPQLARAAPVLRHRLVLNFHAESEGLTTDTLMRRLIEHVPTGPKNDDKAEIGIWKRS